MLEENKTFELKEEEIEKTTGGSTKEEILVEIERLQKIVADLRWQLEFKTMSEADREARRKWLLYCLSEITRLNKQLEEI